MDRVTAIEFRLLKTRSPGRWESLTDGAATPEAMLEAYLGAPTFSCCNVQGGFFIDVNGETWSDESTVDELRMTMIWFDAMCALLRGAPAFGPRYGPWEQSRLVWTRYGEQITMADSSGGDRMYGVTVDLPSLALDVAAHGRAFADWLRAIHVLVARASVAPTSDETRERLLTITRTIPDPSRLATIDTLVDLVGIL